MDLLGNSADKPPTKMRFKPKPPPKREHQPVLAKAKDEIDVDEAKAEHLLRRYHETTSKVRPKIEKKAKPVQVAFGIGGSSRFLKSYGSIKNEAASSDGVIGQRVGKEYKEPWDYYTNYPVMLPMRRPYSGNPELLDEEEFGEDPVRSESVETVTKAAEELGLLAADEGEEKNMFFLQLPAMLPATAQSADPQVPESSNGSEKSQKLCKLESLQEGLIGKMLVYKSGAVKLKLGDTIYDVSAGLNCLFAQDVVAVNAEMKYCCNLGELSKRAVATPDIDGMLEAMSEL
ncbi:hypothetical protein C2S51_001960 [Perilla frutescens var. frutescens]|nr:hypothetical protein C2S51_001960 [Perilla frutescens var. frutescens]